MFLSTPYSNRISFMVGEGPAYYVCIGCKSPIWERESVHGHVMDEASSIFSLFLMKPDQGGKIKSVAPGVALELRLLSAHSVNASRQNILAHF